MRARRGGRGAFAADGRRGDRLQRRGVVVRRHRVRVIGFRHHGHVFVSDVFGDEVVGHQPRRRVDDLGRERRPEARVTRGGRGRQVGDAFGVPQWSGGGGGLGGGRRSDGGRDWDIGGGYGGGGRRRCRLRGRQRVRTICFFAADGVVAVLLAAVLLAVVLLRELTVEMTDRSASHGHRRRRGPGTRRIRFGGGALGGLYEEITK